MTIVAAAWEARSAVASSPPHAAAAARRATSHRNLSASTVRAAPENRAANAATKSRVRSRGRPSTIARAQSLAALFASGGTAPSACSASSTRVTLWSFGRRLAAGTRRCVQTSLANLSERAATSTARARRTPSRRSRAKSRTRQS